MSDKTYPILRFKTEYGWSSLYYYNGNFFYPIFLTKNLERLIRLHVTKFTQQNRELVKSDRKHPDYKNKVELSGL